jgi:hypothetical protein
VSRLKVIASANITEKRRHQDGRILLGSQGSEDEIDIRVSFYITLFGEKVVMRILWSHAIGVAIGPDHDPGLMLSTTPEAINLMANDLLLAELQVELEEKKQRLEKALCYTEIPQMILSGRRSLLNDSPSIRMHRFTHLLAIAIMASLFNLCRPVQAVELSEVEKRYLSEKKPHFHKPQIIWTERSSTLTCHQKSK